jgi:hypothetical protein
VPEQASYVDGVVALVRAATAHQLHRPALARLLDFEERRLPMRDRDLQVDRAAQTCVLALLRRPDAPVSVGDGTTEAEILALDTIAIVRSLVDAAGERGETEAAPLQRRVLHAVFGYLGQPRAADMIAKTRKRKDSLHSAR